MHNANSIHMRDDRETISYRCMFSYTIQIDMCVRVWCVFMQSTCRYLRKLPASVRFSNGVEITFCHFLHSSYFVCVYFMHTWIHFTFATYSHTRLYSAWNMFHSRFPVCFLARSHLCNVSSCHRICWLPLCNIQQLPAISDIYSMFIRMKTRKWKWTNIVVNSFVCFSLEITKTVCFFVLFICT